jgi:hypothetical protein
MRDHRLPTSGALLVLASLIAVPAGAQSEPAAIPTPLAVALVAGAGSIAPTSARVVVGTVPAGWPAALVPTAPAYVVGGMSVGRRLVAVFADSTSRPAATFEKLLEDAGWSRPTAHEPGGFMRGGGRFSSYCRDSAEVVPTAVPGFGKSRFVHVTYSVGRRMSCSVTRPQEADVPGLAIPTLDPPPGATVVAASGSHGGEVESRAQLRDSSRTAAAVAAHYAAQLVAAGWVASPAATSERVAAQPFDARDQKGLSWTGLLTVTASGDRHDLSLRMKP